MPQGYSGRWGHCYDHDVTYSFDKKGWSTCNVDYYLVGIYRGGCDRLYCIEKFRCCKMIEISKYHYRYVQAQNMVNVAVREEV